MRLRGRHASLAAKAAMLGALALSACGKRGDPLPPLRKTPQGVSGLRVAQSGERLEISCTAPRASLDGVPLTVLSVEILRADREGELDKVGQSKAFGAAAGAMVTEFVPLPDPGTTVRVSARVLVKGGASTGTPPVSFTVQPPPSVPTNLRARLGAQGVSLTWEGERPKPVPRATPSPTAEKVVPPSPSPAAAPVAPASPGPTPGPPPFPGGFWVYRRPAAEASYDRPLFAAPTEARTFEDKTAPLGTEVCYVVRAIASVEPLIESSGSNQECVTVRDVTPPASPVGLGVLAREGAIEVSWSPSGDPDLVLYRLYRALPGGGFERLAEVAPGETTYLDKDVRPGLDYRYRLTTVDGAGNESPPTLPTAGRLP